MRLSTISISIFMFLACHLAFSSGSSIGVYKILPKTPGKEIAILPNFWPFGNYPPLGFVPIGNGEQFQVFRSPIANDYFNILPQSDTSRIVACAYPGNDYPVYLDYVGVYDNSFPIDQWQLINAGNGYYIIQNRGYENYVWEAVYNSDRGETYTYPRLKDGNDNQLFRLVKVGCLQDSSSTSEARASFASAVETLSVADRGVSPSDANALKQ